MIKNLSELETKLHLPAGTLKTAIEATTEETVDISGVEIFTKTDFETRTKNLEKQKYDEGKTAGTEITIKEIRTEFGVDVSKKTDVKGLKTALTEKVLADAKIDPDKKVQELTTDLGTMRGNYETEKQKRETLENTYNAEKTQRTIHSGILLTFPKNTIITQEEALQLSLGKAAQSGIAPAIEEGKLVFKKGDTVLKNTTNLEPLGADEVLRPFYEPYLAKVEGGGGGKDNPGQNKAGTLEHFNEEMGGKGIREGSTEYTAEMQKRIAAKTLTV